LLLLTVLWLLTVLRLLRGLLLLLLLPILWLRHAVRRRPSVHLLAFARLARAATNFNPRWIAAFAH